METLNRAQTQKSTSQKKKKATGSDAAAGSARGSEERHSSVAALSGPRGQKRAREIEIEKVCHFRLQQISHCRPTPFSQYCNAHSSLPGICTPVRSRWTGRIISLATLGPHHHSRPAEKHARG